MDKEQMKAAIIYLENNPEIEGKLNTLFGDEFWLQIRYDVIIGISKNISIFHEYVDANFKKYFDILDAIYFATENDLIIYFADIGLYAVIESLDDLSNFIENINEGGTFNVHQIVPLNTKQKLIFTVSDNSKEIIEKITTFIREYLKDEVDIVNLPDQTQITILGKNYESYNKARSAFNSLHAQLSGRDRRLQKLINMIPMIAKRKDEYMMPHINTNSHEELVKILPHLPPGMNINSVGVMNSPIDKK